MLLSPKDVVSVFGLPTPIVVESELDLYAVDSAGRVFLVDETSGSLKGEITDFGAALNVLSKSTRNLDVLPNSMKLAAERALAAIP